MRENGSYPFQLNVLLSKLSTITLPKYSWWKSIFFAGTVLYKCNVACSCRMMDRIFFGQSNFHFKVKPLYMYSVLYCTWRCVAKTVTWSFSLGHQYESGACLHSKLLAQALWAHWFETFQFPTDVGLVQMESSFHRLLEEPIEKRFTQSCLSLPSNLRTRFDCLKHTHNVPPWCFSFRVQVYSKPFSAKKATENGSTFFATIVYPSVSKVTLKLV